MGSLVKKDNTFSRLQRTKPDKVKTYKGKETVRIAKTYKQPDGSIVIVTKKINKDGSISDKLEYRH